MSISESVSVYVCERRDEAASLSLRKMCLLRASHANACSAASVFVAGPSLSHLAGSTCFLHHCAQSVSTTDKSELKNYTLLKIAFDRAPRSRDS